MDRINREQQKASAGIRGVSLVLAGAGTGKTSTLVEKVKNVMKDLHVGPENILILTFSRKAARELRDRVVLGTGEKGRGITAGTFHSFCLDLLRNNQELFIQQRGFSAFPEVMDEDERKKFIEAMIYSELRLFLGMPVRVVSDLMMSLDILDKRTARKLSAAGLMDQLQSLLKRFADMKVQKNIIDYNDMMQYAIDLMEKNAVVRDDVRSRFRFVFVDEFQDVADDNFRLLELLLPDTGRNLFAVGDDWQSIYGFRRARVEYIVNMKKYFPEVTVHRLTVNYRSRKEILTVSSRFIRKNRVRTGKRLVANRGRGGIVRFYMVRTIDQEIRAIADILGRIDGGMSVAILYRNNWQGRYLQDGIFPACRREGVSLMTMHASKGLEFDAVIVAGIADIIIPNRESDIEEERRLLYVACTRAREQLHCISYQNEDGAAGRFGLELGITRKNSVDYS